MNLPNKITLSRTILGPLFLGGMLLERKIFSIFILFLNLLGDILDGYLARKTKKTSKLGEVLDPSVDLLFFLFFGLSFNLKDVKEIDFFLLPIILIMGTVALTIFLKKEIKIFHTETKYFHTPLIYLISLLMVLGIYPGKALFMKFLFHCTWVFLSLSFAFSFLKNFKSYFC